MEDRGVFASGAAAGDGENARRAVAGRARCDSLRKVQGRLRQIRIVWSGLVAFQVQQEAILWGVAGCWGREKEFLAHSGLDPVRARWAAKQAMLALQEIPESCRDLAAREPEVYCVLAYFWAYSAPFGVLLEPGITSCS